MGDGKGVSNIIKRGPLKKAFKKILLGSMIIGVAYIGTAMVYGTKTIYKVKTNYAVALERFGGTREVVQDVGWHFRAPFFTKFEKEVSLMQRELYLDGDISPHTVVSSDKISLLVSGLLTYRVVDPHKWAIEIQNAESLLQRDFNGMVKDVVQGSTEEEIICQRDQLKNKVFKRLKKQPINIGEGLNGKTMEDKYGIELVSFNITDAEYPQNLMEASQRKKELELIADGESQLIQRTYNAHADGVQKFMKETGLSKEEAVSYLNQQRWASAYEKSKDQKTYVINNSNEKLGITIPTEDKKYQQQIEDKVKGLEETLEKLKLLMTPGQGNSGYSNNNYQNNLNNLKEQQKTPNLKDQQKTMNFKDQEKTTNLQDQQKAYLIKK